MDKKFWSDIARSDYAIPPGYTLAELTHELFSYLGSSDPELRDEIAYVVYANWLKREKYSADQARENIEKLLANFETGIGEVDTDSVFLRSFSALLLAETVHNDNKKPFLGKHEVEHILEKALGYLHTEKDPRGYVAGKGWAHALAHTADLMMVLGRSANLEADDLARILDAIAEKMVQSTNHLYAHGEDERLANAVVQILNRGLLSADEIKTWVQSLVEPKQDSWKGAFANEDRNHAFQNTRNFLRSIYLAVISTEIQGRAEFERIFLEAIRNLSTF